MTTARLAVCLFLLLTVLTGCRSKEPVVIPSDVGPPPPITGPGSAEASITGTAPTQESIPK